MNNILKLKLKRVDPVKYAVIASLLTICLMLVTFVPFLLLASLVGAGSGGAYQAGAILGGGMVMIIILPIIYGIVVFIVTLIATALLNYILKKTGGLELSFEQADLDISQIGRESRLKQ